MRFSTIGSVLVVSSLVWAIGCGKKKDEKEEEAPSNGAAPTSPGVSNTEGDSYVMVGTLAITGTALTTAGDWKVINYRLLGGKISSETEFDVDDNGGFEISLGNDAAQKDRLQTIAAGSALSDDDAEFLGNLFGETKERVIEFWNGDTAEVKGYINEFITKVDTYGTSSLLVAYQKSGDPVAEANSFRFIGFDAAGRSAAALPVSKLRGNVNMGSVTVNDSRTATSQLKADEVIIATEGEMDVIASTSDLMKSAVNRHMNKANGWEMTPFYMFMGEPNTFSTVDGSYAVLTDYPYNGLGFYASTRNGTPFTFDDICAAAEASRKEISVTPPATIKMRGPGGDGSLTDSTLLTNKGGSGTASTGTQEGKRTCNAASQNYANGGFYGREDSENDVMINFGTGGSIVGLVDSTGKFSLPEGIWPLKYDGTTIANFDMATSIPVKDGKPQAPALSFKVNTNQSDVVTSVDIKVQMWNGDAYEDVGSEAVPLLKAFMEEIQFSAEKLEGSSSMREQCEWAADGSANLTCTPSGNFTFSGLKNLMASYTAFGTTINFGMFGWEN